LDPPQRTPLPGCWDHGSGSQDPTGYEVGREFTLSDKSEFTETNKVVDFRALIRGFQSLTEAVEVEVSVDTSQHVIGRDMVIEAKIVKQPSRRRLNPHHRHLSRIRRGSESRPSLPDGHLLRKIDRFVDLTGLRGHLGPCYSDVRRPSIDAELMIRMLIVGYCFGICSERQLCEEVHLNLAYRLAGVRPPGGCSG
jgi:hypothetical protein